MTPYIPYGQFTQAYVAGPFDIYATLLKSKQFHIVLTNLLQKNEWHS